MSIPIPAWAAGEMMFKARPKLFKLGWKQMDNYGDGSGRVDCIEKEIDGIIIGTIWGGHTLSLLPRKKGTKLNDDEGYISYTDAESAIEKAKAEIIPIFEALIRRNKRRWDREIKEYEKRIRKTYKKPDFVYTRSGKYGV